jgi:two-component system osmolarity sensor histidine kinase EnvZ
MLIIIIPTIIGQMLAVHLFYQRHWYNVTQHTSSLIANEIGSLLQNIDYRQAFPNSKSYINLKYLFIPNSLIPKNAEEHSEELDIFKHSLDNKITNSQVIILSSEGKIDTYIQIYDDVLKISFPSKVLINPSTYVFVLWILCLTILLLSVSLIFSKNQLKSILDLARALEDYGRGEKIDSYKPTGAKEVRKAGLAFLKMKDRIEKQSAKRTQMLAMISHDLKTPLTRMKLQVEVMDSSEEKEELAYDIDSMKHMIDSYLDFAKGEGGENFVKIELGSWLKEYINASWGNSNIDLNLKKTKIFVHLKPIAFQRAIANLISNSIKHSTKQKISVYSSSSDNVVIKIEDNGTGIDDKDKAKVFKPFYRVDKSRSLDTSSSVGLGLAITKEIITGHYGKITLMDSKVLGGLLVKIVIPRILK